VTGRVPSYDRRVSRRLVVPALLVALAATAVAAPAADAKRCTATKDFDVYAIPSGYEDGIKDVYAASVPRRAKHIRVAFVYAADGRPVRATPFPLQTWTAKLKGFRGDGLLWVQIRLAGYGYGMPVANVTHWRALVSYDC
jgi:hypothetical protein